MLTPTEEQTTICAAANTGANLFVDSLAGTAKTTTLTMIAKGGLVLGGLALAFNVRIKKELEDKFPSTWTVLTLNGLGHRAWGKAIGRRCEVDSKKLGRLVSAYARGMTQDDWSSVRELVSKAMVAGLVPSEYPHKGLVPDTMESWQDIAEEAWIPADPNVIEVAHAVLVASIRESFAGKISYDDQLYMSAMFNGVFPRFPHVLCDEAQDFSLLNVIQLQRAAAAQIIAVGDRRQAIYSFRGAATDAMERIKTLRTHWIELRLTTTFRCPQKVVLRQQSHAPGYNAYHKNPEGRVLIQSRHRLNSVTEEHWCRDPAPADGDVRPAWTWDDIRELKYNDIAIISRNNAQLITMAFRLLKQRVGCRMLGRDIGKNLIALSRKLLPDDSIPDTECVSTISEWHDRQHDLAVANKQDEKIAGIRDRAESLLAVLEGTNAKDAGALRLELAALFARETGTVVLSTGHRAKGFEYDVVILLDPWRIPSRWAKKALLEGNRGPMEQEKNLHYVIETRTKHVLIHANLEDFT